MYENAGNSGGGIQAYINLRQFYEKHMPANNNGNSDSQDFYNGGMMANGRFMITKSIGKGSFGEIFQGLDTQTNKEVAIKMVSLRSFGTVMAH